MDTPKASNKSLPLEASPRDPSDKKEFSDAQIAAKKLDDRIDGDRKDAAGRRLERQQSRRISSFPSQSNLRDASPSVAVRKLSPIRSTENDEKPSADSSQGSQFQEKDSSGSGASSNMSKTSKNFKRDLEAKALARGLRSSRSVRHLGGASSPSVQNIGAKKPPPFTPSNANLKQPPPSGPRRQMSIGDFQPSRIPHFVPNRLQGSSIELEMGELKRSSGTDIEAATPSRGKPDDAERPNLPSRSNSVQRLPAPSFRCNNLARESSMSVLRRTATSNSRNLDQLIAYKTGIHMEDPREEIVEDSKPPAVESVTNGADLRREEHNGVFPNPHVPYAAASPPSLSGMTSSRDLDELIAYKTGIPLEDHSGGMEPGEAEVAPTARGKAEIIKNGDFSSQAGGKMSLAHHKDGSSVADILGGTAEEWIEEEDLAIAIEVQEDMDEDVFIPSAIHNHHEAKTPIYKRRRFYVYCALLFGVAVVMIAGATALGAKAGPESLPEVDLPDNYYEAQSIKSIIEKVIGRENLEDPDTPYYAALDWITNVDKLQVGADNHVRLIQRYVLALFNYQTSNWYSCGAANKTLGEDEDACVFQELVSFFPHRYRSLPSYRWLSNKHECEWAGIGCDDMGIVRGIELVGQNIRGRLPKELTELISLSSMYFMWNEFTGTIPEEYGEEKHLANFVVHHNYLTGTLPQGFFSEMRNLMTLNVGRNFLTGTIPPSINNMVQLKGLFLFSNAFRGPIPDEIGDLSLLTYTRLDKNFLTGTLPSSLGRLHFEELWISQQDISGTIPSELGNIRSLKSIDFHSTLLNGTIPEEFYNMTDLQTLNIYDSSLSGTLSPSIGRLTDLRALRISDNHFSGELPAELGDLSSLGELWVHGNDFNGAVPLEVCSLKELQSLEVVNADCLPMNGIGIAQISCDCCDSCCSPKPKLCKAIGE